MRIMIFGRPGSGKTTFAFKLSQELNLPLYHLDKIFYSHKWIERDYQEFLALQHKMVIQDTWIIDGNSIKSLEMRYQRADVVIYFSLPFYRSLWGLIKRKFFSTKDPRIYDRAPECKEIITWKLIYYTWSLDQRVQPSLAELKNKYPHVRFYKIHNQRDLNIFSEKLVP